MSTIVGSPEVELSPAPGVISAPPLDAAAAVATVMEATRATPYRRIMDKLVTVYAYGILGFGVSFPFIMAGWALVTKQGN